MSRARTSPAGKERRLREARLGIAVHDRAAAVGSPALPRHAHHPRGTER